MPIDLLANPPTPAAPPVPTGPRDLLAEMPQAQPQQVIRHTGWAGNVADAMSGKSAPPPLQAPTGTQLMRQWGDVGGGALTGLATGLPGMPGNFEALGRAGLNALGAPVSKDTFLPTSSSLGNMIAGQPSSPEASQGRFLGEMASPWAAGKLASTVIGPLLKTYAGLRTGTGSTPIQQAFDAGAQGGGTNAAFIANMRGQVPFSDVVDQAKSNLSTMFAARSKAYQDAMASGVIKDPKTLDFQPIKDAITKTANVGSYNGVSLSNSADKVRDAVGDVVKQWEALPPDQFHTAAGLDALKQKLGNLQFEGDLASSTQRGSPGAKIINGVRNAVKDQIVTNFPKYAEVMKDYSDTSDELWNVEKGLSLGDKASVDTSMGKLQSLMRNDVNSRFGGRLAMGQKLDAAGNGTLLPSLAGQSLSTIYPRGLNRVLASGESIAGAFHPAAIPALAADMASSSPRLVGEVAHGLGVLSRPFQQTPMSFGGLPNLGNAIRLGVTSPQVLSRLLPNQIPQPTQ
jgi:hypothetical protein